MGSDNSKPSNGSTLWTSTGYRRAKNIPTSPSSVASSSSAVPTEGISARNGYASDETHQTSPDTDSHRGGRRMYSVSSSFSSYIVPTSATTSVNTKADSIAVSDQICYSSEPSVSPSPPQSVVPSKKLGLWNVGNTCYTNSVIQVLYENRLFRECCEEEIGLAEGDGLLSSLVQLFGQINGGKKARRTTHINPTKFVQRLKEKNCKRSIALRKSYVNHTRAIFRSPDHHDAHEFYSYLMNSIGEELLQRKERQTMTSSPFRSPTSTEKSSPLRRWSPMRSPGDLKGSPLIQPTSATREEPSPQKSTKLFLSEYSPLPQPTTWLHELFQGYLVYETRCLCCENVTQRREPFLDIPLDINPDITSLSTCIRHFARTELLRGKVSLSSEEVWDKYFCDLCGCLQEAERSLRFECLPRVLAIHLKRFRFDETCGTYSRVSSRVEFPLSLSFPPEALSRNHPFIQSTSSIDPLLSNEQSKTSVQDQSQGVAPMNPSVVCSKTNDEGKLNGLSNGMLRRSRPSRSSKLQNGPEFDLSGVVVHIGTSMSHGHYISCVKSDDSWWLYDDHIVQPLTSTSLSLFYGSSDRNTGAKCGYLLFYTSKTPFPFKHRTHPSIPRWPARFFKRSDQRSGSPPVIEIPSRIVDLDKRIVAV